MWAPDARAVSLVLEGGGAPRPLAPEGTSGYFAGAFADLTAGTEYRYRLDDGPPVPDPASRFQPHGVHGPSSVVDPRGFNWSATGWSGIVPDELVIYELHVGTFTAEGTFAGAADRLESLAAPWRHRDRADAGGRLPGPLELGIRRRLAVRAGALLRLARRPASAGRCAPTRSGSP